MAAIEQLVAQCDDPIVFYPYIPVPAASIPPQPMFLDIA